MDPLPPNRQTESSTRRGALSYAGISLKGLCMGAADVVPGVSGGTMAFILGIYEELLESIRSFDLAFLRRLFRLRFKEAFRETSWPFLSALFLGILVAVLSLARVLGWMLENRPVLIWSFFFGLILASVYTVGRRLEKWSAPRLAWALLGAAGTYLLVGMVPLSTPEAPWFLFLSGAVAICAMILPGISGSFILVLLGKYRFVLDAVNNRDLFTLAIVACGAVVGLASFVRLLNWLLKRYHDAIVALLTGLMVGSLRKVWPWKTTLASTTDGEGHVRVLAQANILPPHWGGEVTTALCLALLGFLLVLALNALAGKSDPSRVLSRETQ
jgi:putative membrane protein